MSATPPLPLLKRLPPAVWVAVTWCASTLFTLLTTVRFPGETEPGKWPAAQLYRWDGLTFLVVAAALTLVGSRRLPGRPLSALALLLTAAGLVTTTLGVGEVPLAQFLVVDVALYFIAAAHRRRTGVIALSMALAMLVTWMAVRLLSGWDVGMSAELAVALVTVIAWLLGNATHRTREYADKLSAQAAEQAVTAERLRIAREMHDMVAHSIGIIALQAGAAARVVTTQPEAAREAMTAVENTGRETLSGLRRMLGALRQADHGEAPEAAGLADVDALAAATTAAGVRVDVRRLGERRALPPDVDLSAFRIIQESVTNVVRHAATDSCEVSIDYGDDDRLSIEVADRGRGSGTRTDTGFGLSGMRERVALLHGEFTAGPRPEGGFRVTVRLPVPAPAEAR
ncbi:sensor histidine kinase [Streptomyces avermitilis]|uniref:sensor histidine kinase n=1 Tax=Streptomyces avermitilis TaxID=33903 RepID=UPI0033AC69E0